MCVCVCVCGVAVAHRTVIHTSHRFPSIYSTRQEKIVEKDNILVVLFAKAQVNFDAFLVILLVRMQKKPLLRIWRNGPCHHPRNGFIPARTICERHHRPLHCAALVEIIFSSCCSTDAFFSLRIIVSLRPGMEWFYSNLDRPILYAMNVTFKSSTLDFANSCCLFIDISPSLLTFFLL